jgi:gluconate:H+ symporter, GntP family
MSDTAQLVLAAIAGITILVVLIIWAKLHPILALNLGSFVVGAVAAQNLNDVVLSSRRASVCPRPA